MAEITIRISDMVLKIAGSVVLAGVVTLGVFEILHSGVLLRKYEIRMFMPEASGLKKGAAVQLDGINVGTVIGVTIAASPSDPNRRVDVKLQIEKRYQDLIRADSAASLITLGLLAEPSVSITGGILPRPIEPGGEIRFIPPKESVSAADFLNALTKLADCKKNEKNDEAKKTEAGSNRSSIAK
ncbi:MAG: MCE family protein [Acidobacteria bacterium]|nr:MCE family protein [Acidobacteriota bacterium]MBS1865607.1 MCE family protein [Acidobacteriota bacterium]